MNSFILEAKKRAEVCLFYGQVLLKIYAYWKIGNEQNRLRVKSGFDGIVFLVSKDVRVQNFDKTMKLNEYNAFDFTVSLVSIFSYALSDVLSKWTKYADLVALSKREYKLY